LSYGSTEKCTHIKIIFLGRHLYYRSKWRPRERLGIGMESVRMRQGSGMAQEFETYYQDYPWNLW
jgi:hypothetical protein